MMEIALFGLALSAAIIALIGTNIYRLEADKLQNELKTARRDLHMAQCEWVAYRKRYEQTKEEYESYVRNAMSYKAELREKDALIEELREEIQDMADYD